MAVTRFPPNKIWLGGPRVVINDRKAKEAITPGMLIELVNTAGVWHFQKHAGAGLAGSTYATEQSMLNKGVADDYAIGDLIEALVGAPGTYVWGRIATGQNIVAGAKLESAGTGFLRVLAAGIAVAVAMESKDNTGGAVPLIRIEVI